MFRQVLPGLLWALFIMVLCGIPGRDIPHISFLELLSFDKWVHAGIFFVLFLLWMRGFMKMNLPLKGSLIFILFISCVAYGGLLELLQQLVFEERSADLYDFIANSFGVVVGLLTYKKILA